MCHAKSAPSSSIRDAPATIGQQMLTGGRSPVEAGDVELVEMNRAVNGRRATRGADQPARSMCVLTENCKWCSPSAQDDSDNLTSARPRQEESHPTNAVEALQQCLATLDREREGAEKRRVRFLALMARFLDRDGQAP
ncbi:hypothetical protein Daus18300_008088 [Diaporthe australafricana]|uniref:Uncharacterized protein n=1 Tax=Diaporthe australafricana TaxID=127596 RepID=A0ABR3WJD6_9PEZI